jgi:hypothetical protein
LTLQGRAIVAASKRFGDGKTLPFTPCKRGFIPVVGGTPMLACHLHNSFRQKRFKKEKCVFRKGEFDLRYFWNQGDQDQAISVKNELGYEISAKKEPVGDCVQSMPIAATTALNDA